MDSLIYNIPAPLFGSYRGRRVIVRSHDPAELAECISHLNPDDVLYGQLLSLDVDVTPLTNWRQSVPLDLVMQRPTDEFPILYRFAHLLDKHQIRVSIPVTTEFSDAVRLALALHFSVKLEVAQPDKQLIEELSEILDLYLHRSTISQPVEYFHSIFLSFFHQEPSSLWFIQEEDPEQIRFVSENGEVSLSKRLSGLTFQNQNGLRPDEQKPGSERSECDDCEFFDRCGGYFKWPNKDYSCEGVKTLFGTMRAAAAELGADLNRMPVALGAQQR
jgi:sulfatase maturation enzyme AslB (radical SAM superfamily)